MGLHRWGGCGGDGVSFSGNVDRGKEQLRREPRGKLRDLRVDFESRGLEFEGDCETRHKRTSLGFIDISALLGLVDFSDLITSPTCCSKSCMLASFPFGGNNLTIWPVGSSTRTIKVWPPAALTLRVTTASSSIATRTTQRLKGLNIFCERPILPFVDERDEVSPLSV